MREPIESDFMDERESAWWEGYRKGLSEALDANAPAQGTLVIEECAKVAYDYPTPEGQDDNYQSGFIDACTFVGDAILALSAVTSKRTKL